MIRVIRAHWIFRWDRTVKFANNPHQALTMGRRTATRITLIRLSLWADGLVHQSLDARQILWLTIGRIRVIRVISMVFYYRNRRGSLDDTCIHLY